MRRALGCVAAALWFAGCGVGQSGVPPDQGTPHVEVSPPVHATVAAPVSIAPSSTIPANGQSDPQATPTTQGTSINQGKPTTPGTPPATSPGIPPPDGFKPNAMDECGLHTQWPGDEYCILPPPADKGFQLHIGPSSYDKPEAEYILQPGQETTHTYTATSANDHDIDFYVRQYRMRPGAHHTIVRDTSTGRRLSGSDVNQDHPIGGITAPENAGIGIPLVAHAPISVDHHAINTKNQPLLQEVWVNFWYVDPSKVTDTTHLLYDPGDVTATVAPHANVVLGPYQCDINTPGRLISMFGHVHANNVRFSAWRTRSGQRDLIYESYHWEEPLWLEFTSLAKNPTVDPTNQIDGGFTGIVDLQPGDTLAWECNEVNQQNSTLTFTNQTFTGAMCIIIGDLVGTKCMSRNPMAALFNPNLE
jgi:hypothetical protein